MTLFWAESLVNLGVIAFEGAVEATAEALREWAEMDEEFVVAWADELAGFGVEGEGRSDDVDMRVVANLSVPGVQDTGEAAAGTAGFGGDDVLQGGGAFPQDEVVEDLGILLAEGAQFLGNGEGDEEVGDG